MGLLRKYLVENFGLMPPAPCSRSSASPHGWRMAEAMHA
jgi:hypothetical protein